jgi:tetrahydromethanopterin S-methyltransferase subunit D
VGSFDFWQRWLFVVGVFVIIFGVFIALLNGTVLFDTLFNKQIDAVFWDDGGPNDNSTQDFQQWVYGILGATVAGWGVCLVFIAHYPFKRREPWAWRCLVVSMGLWFVLDSVMSLSARNYFNEFAVNVPLLLLVLLPLWFTRRSFD